MIGRYPLYFLHVLCGGTAILAAAVAQENREVLPGVAPTTARVLFTKVVAMEDGSTVTFNRIERVDLKPEAPPQSELGQVDLMESCPGTEEIAELERVESMRNEFLSVGAVCVAGAGSEVRLWTERGEAIFASSINFEHFRTVTDFQWAGVAYNTFFVVESVDVGDALGRAYLHPATEFPRGSLEHSAFVGVSGACEDPLALKVMEALHAYYDANRERLKILFEESERVRLAEEERLRANPPGPEHTVVNYFAPKGQKVIVGGEALQSLR